MLHHQETDRIGGRARRLGPCGFANVVEATDVWMIEPCHRASFAFEPLSPIGIGSEMFRQHLDGDDAIQTGVPRLVDFAHSTGPDQPDIS